MDASLNPPDHSNEEGPSFPKRATTSHTKVFSSILRIDAVHDEQQNHGCLYRMHQSKNQYEPCFRDAISKGKLSRLDFLFSDPTTKESKSVQYCIRVSMI
mmetsp:Transcript_29292/g.79288  ORF Transcript_29292/g.79288 Transcript_29292/m.79288 type:complete len:100 (-) Transcript_29292:2117-2416(-)